MEYPKINSLWKRQFTEKDSITGQIRFLDKGKSGNPLIPGDYSEPEFGNIKKWHVEEKVDGTNIRIKFCPKVGELQTHALYFEGRTSNAQIPPHLLSYLNKTFTSEVMNAVFPDASNVILFGEGYGPKIQGCGSNYRSDAGFILFDVVVGGWWLKREDVREIALKLNIPACPDLGVMSEDDIVSYVKSKPLSKCSLNPQMMEGVICRSDPLMLFRNGKPMVFKLKCRDFN